MRLDIYPVTWRAQADLQWFLFCAYPNLLNLLFKIKIKSHTTFYLKKLPYKIIWIINHFSDHPINTSWKPTTFQAVWKTRRIYGTKQDRWVLVKPTSHCEKKAVKEIINMILLYVNKWRETKGRLELGRKIEEWSKGGSHWERNI